MLPLLLLDLPIDPDLPAIPPMLELRPPREEPEVELPELPTTGWPKVVVCVPPKVWLAYPNPTGDAINWPKNELVPKPLEPRELEVEPKPVPPPEKLKPPPVKLPAPVLMNPAAPLPPPPNPPPLELEPMEEPPPNPPPELEEPIELPPD